MEGKRYLFVIAFGLLTVLALGQNKSRIYQAFITGDMTAWKGVIDEMESASLKSNAVELELISYQIGYIGWCIGMERYDEAKKYIELCDAHIDVLKKKQYELSYLASYEGALGGLKIGLNHFYAIFIGPGIISKAEHAIALNPKNADGYIILGNAKYYMWAMLGGSKDVAIEYYTKAERIMEQEGMVSQNWNYLSLLTMLAHAYEEVGNQALANDCYKKILRVEPEYSWIRDEVYPQFLKDYEKK